jgi:hypothetical protein
MDLNMTDRVFDKVLIEKSEDHPSDLGKFFTVIAFCRP